MNFFRNLFKEMDNNPALMIICWLLFTMLIVTNYASIIDLFFIIFGLAAIIFEIRKYRRKY